MTTISRMGRVFSLLLVFLVIFVSATAAAPMTAPKTDQVVFNNEFVVMSGEHYFGDVVAIGSRVVVEEGAFLDGDLILFAGELDLQGMINGNVISYGAEITGDTTRLINGELIAFGDGGSKVRVDAEDHAMSVFLGSGSYRDFFSHLWNGLGLLLGMVMTGFVFSTIAILFHLIAKTHFKVTLDSLQREPVISLMAGVVLMIVTPILAVLLAITILLIPLSLVLILFYVLAVVFSVSTLGLLVGRFLRDILKTNWTEIVQIGVGTFVFVIGLVLLMKVPCMGWSLAFLIVSFGLGAFVLSRFGSKQFSRSI